MPKDFDFNDMVRLISPARLASYHSTFTISNKAELFGLYSWNLEFSGVLSSLLQLVEVALRNAINEAGKICIPTHVANQHWFDVIPYHLIEDDRATIEDNASKSLIRPNQVKGFSNGIAKAKNNARRLLNKKLGNNTTALPTLDQIISQTDFSVWEYVLDKSFYDGDVSKGFLWPKGFIYAFKKLPVVTGKNKLFQQRDILRRRVESIRMLRNRIAHNEPIWKEVGHRNDVQVIESLKRKIDEVIELTYWISPSLNAFLRNSALMHRLNVVVSEYEINNARYRNPIINVEDIEMFRSLLSRQKESNRKVFISSGGFSAFIQSKNYRFS